MECERYKMFLEKITPGEWKEDQHSPQLAGPSQKLCTSLNGAKAEEEGAKEEGTRGKACTCIVGFST